MAAGLAPVADWIIGSPDVIIASQDDLYNFFIHNQGKPIRLTLYNNKTEQCRLVKNQKIFD